MSEPRYKRGTGRTRRMVAEAFRKAYDGNRVVIVVSSLHELPHIGPMIQDLGADKSGPAGFKVGANGIITVLPMSAHGVRVEVCQVEGWRKDNAFFDHDVIYKFYQRIIDDYQRYDANQQ